MQIHAPSHHISTPSIKTNNTYHNDNNPSQQIHTPSAPDQYALSWSQHSLPPDHTPSHQVNTPPPQINICFNQINTPLTRSTFISPDQHPHSQNQYCRPPDRHPPPSRSVSPLTRSILPLTRSMPPLTRSTPLPPDQYPCHHTHTPCARSTLALTRSIPSLTRSTHLPPAQHSLAPAQHSLAPGSLNFRCISWQHNRARTCHHRLKVFAQLIRWRCATFLPIYPTHPPFLLASTHCCNTKLSLTTQLTSQPSLYHSAHHHSSGPHCHGAADSYSALSTQLTFRPSLPPCSC
jgi:hypothetical protein